MDRRKFIKTSMCLGCGVAIIPASQSPLLPQLSSNFSKDKFIYKRKEDLPKKIRIEACSLCQLNCPACWMRKNEKKFKKTEGYGYLKFSDFKNLVDDNPQIKTIELVYDGEIFLNPELDKIIEYAYIKNVKLTAENGVNLNDLTEEMAEHLVKYRFKNLYVSIDAATPEVYKIYRRGGDFNRVISNIQKINKYKKIYNSKYPELTYKFIVFGHNEHEIELAKQKAKNLNMNILFVQNCVDSYSPVKNKELVYKQTGIDLRNSNMEREINLLKNGQKYFYCYQLLNEPQINWNGNLLGCNVLLYNCKSFNINVFEKGLFKALNSKYFVESKHMVTDTSYKPQYTNPCEHCFAYEILKKQNLHINA